MYLKNIKFKPIKSIYLKKILTWRNQRDVRSKMINQKIISYSTHKSWYEALKKNKRQKVLIIYFNNLPIGLATIKEIDKVNKTCTWGFYIGEKSFRYLGLLVEIKLIDIMFNRLKIRKIWGETLSDNKKILKIHFFLGFKKEGLLKKHIRQGNNYHNIIITSLFYEDWIRSKKKIFNNFKKKKLFNK